jgi:hypothetical protein
VGPAEIRHRSENRAADTHRGSGAAFLDRFLAGRGVGPHHFNFLVTDIEDALTLIKASGIEPIGVNLANPDWKEAFLHPRNTHGIVIQVAQHRSATAQSPTPHGTHPSAASPART